MTLRNLVYHVLCPKGVNIWSSMVKQDLTLVNSFGKVCKQLPVNLLITRLDKKTPPYAFFIKMRPIFINVTEVHVNFKVKMLNYLCSTYSLWFKKMVGKFREIRLFFLDFLLSIYITHFLGCRSDILRISMV